MTSPIRWVALCLGLALLSPAPAARAQEIIPGKDWYPALSERPEGGIPRQGRPTEFDIAAWEARRYRGLSNWPPAEANPPVDVVHYDLNLTFGLADTTITGTATVTLVWGNDPGNVLHLDLTGLTATAVKKPKGGPFPYFQDADGLDITVNPAPSPGDTVRMAIDYHGHPTRSFYVRPSASYTFTEPEGSRAWFPCRDVPWDKATLSLHGRVPSGKTLVSNGVLDSTSTAGGFVTYHWREDHPLATYLMAAAISAYSQITTPSSVTSLGWYVYPAHVGVAATSFQNLAAMVAFFDASLAPYPFDKYVMCEANFGGGMEHQTATLMGEGIVTAGLTNEWITAHELAHQWFGDYVTLADWQHIWLNEGFATFYEAAWQENFYGPATFAQRMQTYEANMVTWWSSHTDHAILDPPPSQLFSAVEYYKAAWVLRMLRDLVGKPAFDTAVRNYLSAHAFGNAQTADFQAAVEAQYGASLAWFFDQWVVSGTGRPQLAYVPVYTQVASGWLVQLDIRQVQASPTTYRFPLEVRITTSAGQTTVSAWVLERHQVLAFPVSSEPLAVVLDPENRILGEMIAGSPTGVEVAAPPPAALQAFPNPFRGTMHLRTSPLATPEVVEVFDVSGRKLRELPLAPGETSVAWDGRDRSGQVTPPGAYFLRLRGQRAAVRVIRLEGR